MLLMLLVLMLPLLPRLAASEPTAQSARAQVSRSRFSKSSSPARRRAALLLHLSPTSRGRPGELSRELSRPRRADRHQLSPPAVWRAFSLPGRGAVLGRARARSLARPLARSSSSDRPRVGAALIVTTSKDKAGDAPVAGQACALHASPFHRGSAKIRKASYCLRVGIFWRKTGDGCWHSSVCVFLPPCRIPTVYAHY